MYDIKTKEIEGMTFSVVPFSAVEALRLKAYIIRLFGPAVGQLLGNVDIKTGNLADLDLAGDQLGTTLEKLFESLTEDTFLATIKWILKRTSVQLKAGDTQLDLSFGDDRQFENAMDNAFQGRIFSIYSVLLFVLEVNFPDLFLKAGSFGTRPTTFMSQQRSENGSKS